MRHFLCTLSLVGLAASGILAATPAKQVVPAAEPTALVLPAEVSTPDGMTVGRDGRIYLVVLNFQVPASAAVWTLDADHQPAKLVDLPVHPKTEGLFPLGIAEGSDGHLYVADNQSFGGHMDHQSRLLRVVMADGRAVRVETVATGFIAANAVEAFGDRIYVTETCLINESEPHVSGIYKLELSELDAERPVRLIADGRDPRLVARLTTTAADWRKGVGANGLAIAPDGRLFVCNFGEASILTAPLKPDGHLASPLKVLAKGGGMESTDGMKYLTAWDKLVVADFFGNAVHLVDAKSGKVKTLAKNPNSTGAGGKLDKPSEPCVRGSTLYVSNIDLPYDGNEAEKPDTLTLIPLKVK